jgi:hypothetical protein
VTLYEAYMGIEPHFNPWNYFFYAWLRQGSDVEMMVLGSVDIYVRSGLEVDPYFLIPMPEPLIRWRRTLFLLRDNVVVLLPAFTGCRPIPHPKWGYNVDQIDIRRLQPLLEAV